MWRGCTYHTHCGTHEKIEDTLGSQFISSAMCVPGIKCMLSGLAANGFYLLNHLTTGAGVRVKGRQLNFWLLVTRGLRILIHVYIWQKHWLRLAQPCPRHSSFRDAVYWQTRVHRCLDSSVGRGTKHTIRIHKKWVTTEDGWGLLRKGHSDDGDDWFLCLVTFRPLCGYCHIEELNPGLGNRKQQGLGKARPGNASCQDSMGIWITVWARV